MTLKDNIANILETLLEDGKYYLVDLQVSPSKSNQKIIVLLDSDEGISIDECALISRKLDDEIFQLELIQNAYTLEVSSPGIDYPLKFERQYTKNIGRELKVVLKDGTEKIGKLTEADAAGFKILPKQGRKKDIQAELNFKYDEVSKAQVQISFR